jgi:CRISPR/Cas system-associated exonuclease Cas4 (RecB family)
MSEALRLSVSKTKTYLSCKAKYKFGYIDKLPKKEFDYHIFGKFCHKVLEDFHNVYINGSQEPYNIVMAQAFKAALSLYKGKMTAEMKKDCWTIIDNYLRSVSSDKKNNLSANVIACEKNFEFLVGGNVILNGMIDRVQIDADNVVHVCDYKTSKSKKYLAKDFFQLLTYAYVIVSENPDIDKVRASYIMLRHNFEYITAEFSVPEIMKIEEKYADYAQQITLEKEFAPNPTILCRYCDFAEVCTEGKKMLDPSKIYGEVDW